ncbi:MAG: OmpA family protein [Chlorobiales bacterium]|nr:OmpA family protein [Chlorobiales bacterium]
MKKLFLMICAIVFLSLNAMAQETVYNQYFSLSNQLLDKARQLKADVYSPKNFGQAMKYYNDAQSVFKKSGSLQEIQQNTDKAEAYLKKSLEFSDLARLTFANPIEARNQASSALASKYSPETWSKAEKIFKGAMEEMEDNDLQGAKDEANEAEKIYRKAELEAIKVNLVGPAKELLKKAEKMGAEDYAPATLKEARQSISEVEKLIDQNRYAQEEGLSLAKKAKYHAQHALFLTREIKELKKKDYGFEEQFLSNEAQLNKVAEALDIDLDLSQGYTAPVDTVATAIKSLRNQNEKFQQDLNSRNEQISMMQQQIASMEKSIGKYSESEKELRRKIEQKKAQENTVKSIAQSFSQSEGEVFVSGDNVTIRLYGLTFASGRSEIKTEYFSLLKKVLDGIKQFKNCQVVVEGNTDSQGSAKRNQELSEQRAKSVREYIIANMSFSADKIKAAGYGETKPIANNETAAGRAKNRRIDVVITPEWSKQ